MSNIIEVHPGAPITGWICQDIHPTAYTEDINVLRFWHQEGAEVIPLVPLADLVVARDSPHAHFPTIRQPSQVCSNCCEEGRRCSSNLCKPDPAHPPFPPPTEVPA